MCTTLFRAQPAGLIPSAANPHPNTSAVRVCGALEHDGHSSGCASCPQPFTTAMGRRRTTCVHQARSCRQGVGLRVKWHVGCTPKAPAVQRAVQRKLGEGPCRPVPADTPTACLTADACSVARVNNRIHILRSKRVQWSCPQWEPGSVKARTRVCAGAAALAAWAAAVAQRPPRWRCSASSATGTRAATHVENGWAPRGIEPPGTGGRRAARGSPGAAWLPPSVPCKTQEPPPPPGAESPPSRRCHGRVAA